jgi:hypothetical protein
VLNIELPGEKQERRKSAPAKAGADCVGSAHTVPAAEGRRAFTAVFGFCPLKFNQVQKFMVFQSCQRILWYIYILTSLRIYEYCVFVRTFPFAQKDRVLPH